MKTKTVRNHRETKGFFMGRVFFAAAVMAVIFSSAALRGAGVAVELDGERPPVDALEDFPVFFVHGDILQ